MRSTNWSIGNSPPWVNIGTRVIIGLLFVVSAIDKMVHPEALSNVLSYYPFASGPLVHGLLFFITSVEFFLGVALLSGIWFKVASLGAAGLLCIYTAFLTYSIVTGNTNHGCGCFQSGSGVPAGVPWLVGGNTITVTDVVRDVVFIALSLIGFLTYNKKLGLDGLFRDAGRTSDLASWNDNRLRSYFVSGALFACMVSVAAGSVSIAVLSTEERSPLANAIDYHPIGKTLGIETTAPTFSLSTVNGRTYNLKTLRGKVVLIELFALWCPHCQAEAPIIHQIVASMPASNFQALSVIASPYSRYYDSSGGTDLSPYTAKDVSWFRQKFHVINPILVDPRFQVTNEYLGQWYPTIYIVNKSGMVARVFSGNTSRSTILRAIHAEE